MEALTNDNLPEEYRMALARALQDDLFSKASFTIIRPRPLPSLLLAKRCFSLLVQLACRMGYHELTGREREGLAQLVGAN